MSAGRTVLGVSILIIANIASGASAAETITYTYDPKGRIVQVVHSGTVNNNLQTTYQHDHADNRSHVTVTGTSH